MEDNYLKNYGMMIPQQAVDLTIKPNPNGVPIYAKCPSDGLCACTGACRKILGYDIDPVKVQQYHDRIAERNQLLKERAASFQGSTVLISEVNGVKTYSWERKQQ